MRRIVRLFLHRPNPNDDGFTFVEVIASVLILAIVGFLIWQGSIIATRGLFKSSNQSVTATRLFQLDEALRRETGKVVVPFWIADIETSSATNRIEIPFYGGDPDDYLRIDIADDYLNLSAGDVKYRAGPFPGLTAVVAMDRQKQTVGIRLRFQDSVENLYHFGSFTLR